MVAPHPPSTPAGTATRVAPAFAEAIRFLQGTETGRPAVFVLSFEGLRAVAAVTGVQYDPATFPLVAASYLRLPGFHAVVTARADNPLAATSEGIQDTSLRADSLYGRVFLSGIRPGTLPFILSWDEGDARYKLVPMN